MNMYNVMLFNSLVDSECDAYLRKVRDNLRYFDPYTLSATTGEPVAYIKQIQEGVVPSYVSRYNTLMTIAEELYTIVDDLSSVSETDSSFMIEFPEACEVIANIRCKYNEAHYDLMDNLSSDFMEFNLVFARMCVELLELCDMVDELRGDAGHLLCISNICDSWDREVSKFILTALRSKTVNYFRDCRYVVPVDMYKHVIGVIDDTYGSSDIKELWEEGVNVCYTQTGYNGRANLSVMVPDELVRRTLQDVDACSKLGRLLIELTRCTATETGELNYTLHDMYVKASELSLS